MIDKIPFRHPLENMVHGLSETVFALGAIATLFLAFRPRRPAEKHGKK